MVLKRIAKFSVVVFLLTGLASYSFAAFKTNRIGNTKGLDSTPVADLITALNSKLSDFDNSTLESILSDSSSWLTNEDIKDLNLDLSSFGGYPLDYHELAFLTHSLASAVNDGSLTLGTSQASLQDAIDDDVVSSLCSDSDCAETSADWVHGQVSDDNFSNNVSLITASLIDDLIGSDNDYIAGYTSLVLGANSDVGISDLQSDPFFQAIVNPSGNTIPSTSEVMNAINLVADFVVPATPGSPTSSEYSAGQSAVNAFLDNSDTSSFTVADFLECYNNTETDRSGGANTCNISASQWETNSSELTYFAEAKEDIDDNITLTAAQLTNIGLDLSGLGDPVPTLALEYLSDTLDSSATLTSAWQTTINAYDVSTASLWKVAQIAAGDSNHPTSDLTVALLEDAGMTDNATTTTGATLSSLKTNITASSLTTSSSGADIDTWVISVAGFASGTTLSEITTATGNGWDLSMYADATSYDGWTTSADDFNSYYDCHGSYESLTGGLDSCELSLEDWDAVNSLASASSADDLTSDDIEGILSASGTTDNSSAFGDLSNLTSLESDYIKDCMGTSVTSSALTSCVTSATSTTVPIFKIAQKVSGDLTGAITVSELQNTGLETLEAASDNESVIDFLNQSKCGTNNNQSCIDYVFGNNCGSGGTSACASTSDISSGSSATQSEVLAYVRNAVLKYSKRVVDVAALPTGQSGSRCSSITISAPHPCGSSNPAYTCTGLSGWTFNDNGGSGTLTKSEAPISGNLSAKVRVKRKAWYGGSAYQRDLTVGISLTSASSSDTTYSYTWQSYGVSAGSMRGAMGLCSGTVLSWSSASSANKTSTSHGSLYPSSDQSNPGSSFSGGIGRFYYFGSNVCNGYNVGYLNPCCGQGDSCSGGGTKYLWSTARVLCRTQVCN